MLTTNGVTLVGRRQAGSLVKSARAYKLDPLGPLCWTGAALFTQAWVATKEPLLWRRKNTSTALLLSPEVLKLAVWGIVIESKSLGILNFQVEVLKLVLEVHFARLYPFSMLSLASWRSYRRWIVTHRKTVSSSCTGNFCAVNELGLLVAYHGKKDWCFCLCWMQACLTLSAFQGNIHLPWLKYLFS